MLGIYTTKITKGNRPWYWISCYIRFIESLIGILSFGYLSTNWSMRWLHYYLQRENEKEK